MARASGVLAWSDGPPLPATHPHAIQQTQRHAPGPTYGRKAAIRSETCLCARSKPKKARRRDFWINLSCFARFPGRAAAFRTGAPDRHAALQRSGSRWHAASLTPAALQLVVHSHSPSASNGESLCSFCLLTTLRSDHAHAYAWRLMALPRLGAPHTWQTQPLVTPSQALHRRSSPQRVR